MLEQLVFLYLTVSSYSASAQTQLMLMREINLLIIHGLGPMLFLYLMILQSLVTIRVKRVAGRGEFRRNSGNFRTFLDTFGNIFQKLKTYLLQHVTGK